MVKISSVFKGIIVFCTIIMLRYLLLLPASWQLGAWFERGVVACAGVVLAFLTLLVGGKNNNFIKHCKWLFRYLIPLGIVLLFSTIYTAYLYNYSLHNIVLALIPYTYVLFAIPLIYIFYQDRTIFRFLWIVAILQLIILVCKSFGWYFYNFKVGNTFFQALTLEFDDWSRNGLQRVECGQLFSLTLMLTVYYGFKQGIRMRYMFILAGMLLYLIFIFQVRFQTTVSIISIFIMLYFMYNKKKLRWQMRMLLIVALIIILGSGVIGWLLESASSVGVYAGSSTARISTMEHYFGIMAEKRSFLGLGLLQASNQQAAQIIYKNAWSNYYLDDIGIFGGIVRFGILSVIVYGWLFVLSLKTCWRCYKNQNYKYLPFLLGMSVYMIISCIILNFYDWQRSYALAFYLAIISFIDEQLRIKESEKYDKMQMKLQT